MDPNNKNLKTLFIVRLISAINISVMFASLALFLGSSFSIKTTTATNLVASFLALNYILPLLGGFIGNRYVNFKKLFCYGTGAQFVADWVLAFHTRATLTFGLALFLMSSMVATVSIVYFVNECAGPDSDFRRRMMLWSYTAMNLGFLIGFFIAGVFGLHNAYPQLFMILSVLPIISIILFNYFLDFEHVPTNPVKSPLVMMLIIMFILVLVIHIALQYIALDRRYLLALSFIGIVYLIHLASRKGHIKLISVLLFYMAISISFWTVYLLTPEIVFNLIEAHANRIFHGITIAPQWVDITDSIILAVFAPLLAYVIARLKENYRIHINTSLLFAIAIAIVALAAYYLSHASITLFQNDLLPLHVFVLYIALLALAEVFIGPEGYNLPRSLAPDEVRGMATGTWVSSLGIASLIASYIGDKIDMTKVQWNLDIHRVFYHLSWLLFIIATVTILIGTLVDRRIRKQLL